MASYAITVGLILMCILFKSGKRVFSSKAKRIAMTNETREKLKQEISISPFRYSVVLKCTMGLTIFFEFTFAASTYWIINTIWYLIMTLVYAVFTIINENKAYEYMKNLDSLVDTGRRPIYFTVQVIYILTGFILISRYIILGG